MDEQMDRHHTLPSMYIKQQKYYKTGTLVVLFYLIAVIA